MSSRTTADALDRLARMEALLETLVDSVKRFEEFVLEVSPAEAKAEILELEKEL